MPFSAGYALVIGVGRYQHMSRYDVPIAAEDARAVRDVLQDAARCAYPPEQVTLLTDQDATRSGILSALDAFTSKLQVDSTLFLFFVGHGLYGTDGNYYLTTHDTKLVGRQAQAGTGVSEVELIEKLRAIKAKRVMVVVNACHSGELSPSFDVGEEPLPSEAPPQKLADAVLSTGEGRITITACRPDQKSWIGRGKLSIFTEALVNGLRGDAPNSRGYVSAYGLYEHLYFTAKETAAEQVGQEQEAELTVLKGVGPFPVALYRGASSLGEFDASEPVPADTAARQVSPERSQRAIKQYNATLIGNGAIAQGDGAVAIGSIHINAGDGLNKNIVIGNGNLTADQLSGNITVGNKPDKS